MHSVDKLLTHTTNRLPLLPLPLSPAPAHPTHQIQMPMPIHAPRELAALALREEFLERQITQAKTEQNILLELFEQMARVECGQAKLSKKLHRRCNRDILERLPCPYASCKRYYSSQATLQRHVKLKHKIVKHEPPQPYRDLPPEPNLTTGFESQSELDGQWLDEASEREKLTLP